MVRGDEPTVCCAGPRCRHSAGRDVSLKANADHASHGRCAATNEQAINDTAVSFLLMRLPERTGVGWPENIPGPAWMHSSHRRRSGVERAQSGGRSCEHLHQQAQWAGLQGGGRYQPLGHVGGCSHPPLTDTCVGRYCPRATCRTPCTLASSAWPACRSRRGRRGRGAAAAHSLASRLGGCTLLSRSRPSCCGPLFSSPFHLSVVFSACFVRWAVCPAAAAPSRWPSPSPAHLFLFFFYSLQPSSYPSPSLSPAAGAGGRVPACV